MAPFFRMASQKVQEKRPAFTNFAIKVDIKGPWQMAVAKVLKSVDGVINFKMGDDGTVKISGLIEPAVLLKMLAKAGKTAKMVHWQYGECSSNLFLPDPKPKPSLGSNNSYQGNNSYYGGHGNYYPGYAGHHGYDYLGYGGNTYDDVGYYGGNIGYYGDHHGYGYGYGTLPFHQPNRTAIGPDKNQSFASNGNKSPTRSQKSTSPTQTPEQAGKGARCCILM